MGTTPLQGFTIPDLSGAPNGPTNFSTFGGMVEKQVVQFYATVAARDAAITSPVENMLACTRDLDRMWMYTGSAWQFIGWYTTAGRPGVILTDAAQSITNTLATDVTWGTEVGDVDGWTSGGSATLTVPSGWDGFYTITYSGVWAASPGATNSAHATVSGSISYACTAATSAGVETLSFVRSLVAGDTLKFSVYQSSGGALNVVSRLDIAWLGR